MDAKSAAARGSPALEGRLARYGFAAALAGGAIAIEASAPEFFKPVIYFLFYPTSFLTAWLAGMGPAMLHLVLGILAVHWVFVAVEGGPGLDPAALLRMALFAGFNTFAAWLISRGSRAEAGLRASEEAAGRSLAELNRAQKVAGVGSWRLDIPRDELTWSEETYRMFGLPPGTRLTYAGFLERVHPDDRGALDAAWKEALRGRKYDVEHRIEVGGQERWVHEKAEFEFDSEGRPLVGIGTVQDVTERKRAAEDLRRLGERERFREALEAAAASMVLVRRDGRIAYLNKAAERLFGWTRDELNGQLIEVLIPERFREGHVANRERFFREAEPGRPMGVGRDLVALRKDRAEVPIEAGLTRMKERLVEFPAEVGLGRMSNGEQEFVVVSLIDISTRKAMEEDLRESEEKLKLFIEYAPAALAMFDRGMRYIAASRRWMDDYSLGGRSVIGLSHYEVFPEIPERWKEIHRRGLAGETSRSEEDRFVRLDGSVQWLRWTVRPWNARDGSVGGIVIFSEDITELKHSESRLKQSVVELEAFAHTISHDLRAPLRAIEGYSTFLTRSLGERVDPESRRMLDRIGLAAARLDRLIRDLLSFNAIGRADVVLEAVDLDEIVGHVAAHYPELAKSRLSVRSPLGKVRGQTSLLIQVLSNLLTNAAKFVPKDRTPEIEVRTERREAGRLLLVVQDNGIGISPEAVDRIFQPFVRLHTTEAYEGTGIGLALVRRAAERMGGTVCVDSKPGEGSRFWVEFQEA